MSLVDPSSVDALLNYRLSRLLASSGALVIRLCEGRYGVTRREWRLLSLLSAHGDISPSALADHAHLDRPRVSRAIADLQAKRLVDKTTLPDDRRRTVVRLTALGQRLHDELFPQIVELNQRVLQVLPPDEVQLLDRALTRLTQAAESLAQTHPMPAKADRRHGGSRKVARRNLAADAANLQNPR
jgi:DNA-binding MarR family transcriptional regulator